MDVTLAGEALSVGYRRGAQIERQVLEGIDASLAAGELVCLLGPNGVGKTTLLRTLAGLLDPLAGRVLLGGEDLHLLDALQRAQRIAVVLTEPIRVGLLKVEALVGLGRYPHTDWLGRLADRDREEVEGALERVGASDLAGRQIGELSDGERQKVMIARAVAQSADVMILDEPTAFLDVGRRVEVMAILKQLARQAGRSLLVATHDLELALQSADRLWLLRSDGTLRSGGPEDLVLAGAIADLLAGAAAHFDAETGRLRVASQQRGTARLEGEGLAARWTRRALEREGFHVVAGASADVEVRIRSDDEGFFWQTRRGGEERRHGAIYDLLRSLR